MTAAPPHPDIERHHLLDAMRFVAAMVVVLFHYQHFFYVAPGTPAPGYDIALNPLPDALSWAYGEGSHGVFFFFVLSGFVFHWLYFGALGQGAVTVRGFAVSRFSRLYPLHLVTLIAVAAMQAAAAAAQGAFIVYPENDLRHFLLNLGFVSNWGLQDGHSFNAPVWSVSVEILLYLTFLGLALTRLPMAATILIGAALGALAAHYWAYEIGWGALCFFAGGLAFLAWNAARRRLGARALLASAALLAGLACAATALAFGAPEELFEPLLYTGAFPAAVLAAALLQHWRPALGRRAARLGDLSYAIYLLHFPLQLLILLADRSLDLAPDYRSPLFLAGFLAALMLLSHLSHRRFERPVQSALRRRLT